MTDNEIIKALEISSLALMYDEEQSLYKLALDLINRQQAEIENYSHNVKQLASDIRNYQVDLQAMRNSANSFKSKYKSAVDTAKTLQSVIKEKDAEIERLREKNKRLFAENVSITHSSKKIEAEAIKEFAEKIYTEINEALAQNHKVKVERINKLIARGIKSNDEFCYEIDGKILALRGIGDFIQDLVKELGVNIDDTIRNS